MIEDRYFRTLTVSPDGTETVSEPCIREHQAKAFCEAFNSIGCGTAVMREIDTASIRLKDEAIAQSEPKLTRAETVAVLDRFNELIAE